MLCRYFLYLHECPNLSLKSISLVNTRFIHSLHTTVSKVCKYQIGFGCLFRFLKVAYIYDSFWFTTLTWVPFQNWNQWNFFLLQFLNMFVCQSILWDEFEYLGIKTKICDLATDLEGALWRNLEAGINLRECVNLVTSKSWHIENSYQWYAQFCPWLGQFRK